MDIELTVGFTEKHCGTCGESDADKYKRLYEAEKVEHVKTAQIKLNAIASAERLRDQLEKCNKKAKRKKVVKK